MNTVEPIRDKKLVNDIAEYLRIRSERNFVMFVFGIYSGLRISDILEQRVRDVRDANGKIKSHIYIREKKTGKEKRFVINDELKDVLQEYVQDKPGYEYLFKSRKGLNKPITREYAYQILRDAAQAFRLESIGTHTMRKTFGYHLYQETKDAVSLQKIFNHSHVSITLLYIGVTQDMKDNMVKKLSFKLNTRKKRK